MLNTEYYVATTLTLCDGSDRLCVLLIYIEVLRSCIFLGLWRNIVDFLDLSGNRRLVQTLQNVALRFPPPNFVKLGGNLSFDCSVAVGLLRNQCCIVSFWQKYGSRFIFFRNPYRSGWCSGGFSWVDSSKFARRTPIILTWTIACHFASGTPLAGRTLRKCHHQNWGYCKISPLGVEEESGGSNSPKTNENVGMGRGWGGVQSDHGRSSPLNFTRHPGELSKNRRTHPPEAAKHPQRTLHSHSVDVIWPYSYVAI
jgi:hypothetical protein